MRRRLLLSACLTLTSPMAFAEEGGDVTTLSPTCAEVDVTTDQLPPERREHARNLLARALERADQLVVEKDCTEHFTASHEVTGETVIVRVRGPKGARKVRDVAMDDLFRVYARVITSLLQAQAPAVVAPTRSSGAGLGAATTSNDPIAPNHTMDPTHPFDTKDNRVDSGASNDTSTSAATEASTPIEVSPDRMLYAQLSRGTFSFGYGIGYRHQAGHLAVDALLATAGDANVGATTFGVEALYIARPRAKATGYIGGGVGYASQHAYAGSGSGTRLELTGGIAFARDGALRWFTQLDIGIPLFDLVHPAGTESNAPSFALTVGAGF